MWQRFIDYRGRVCYDCIKSTDREGYYETNDKGSDAGAENGKRE